MLTHTVFNTKSVTHVYIYIYTENKKYTEFLMYDVSHATSVLKTNLF